MIQSRKKLAASEPLINYYFKEQVVYMWQFYSMRGFLVSLRVYYGLDQESRVRFPVRTKHGLSGHPHQF